MRERPLDFFAGEIDETGGKGVTGMVVVHEVCGE